MRRFGKISARDRSLLVLLVGAITFYLCYTFVIVPGLDKNILLRGEIAATQAELQNAKQLAQDSGELIAQEKKLKQDLIKKYSVFFNNLDQANLLYRLDSMMLASGLRAAQYLPSPVQFTSVVLEQGEYIPPDYPIQDLSRKIEPKLAEGLPAGQAADASGNEAGTPDSIPCFEVMVNFEGATYESVYSFVNSLEQMNKTVIVRSLDYAVAEGGIRGQLLLDFYALPGLDPAQPEDLRFTSVLPKGKTNPFR